MELLILNEIILFTINAVLYANRIALYLLLALKHRYMISRQSILLGGNQTLMHAEGDNIPFFCGGNPHWGGCF